MWEYLLYLFFFLIVLFLVCVVSHYVAIFKDKEREQFDRTELTDFRSFFVRELLSLFEANGSMQYGIPAFLLGAILAHIWSVLGGAIGSPHYTSEFGNYFFLSPLLFLLIAFGYPFVFDAFFGEKRHSDPFNPILLFFSQEIPFLSGVAVSTIAANMAVYGMYHEVYFLFTFITSIVVFGLLIYKINWETFFGLAKLGNAHTRAEEDFEHMEEIGIDDELEI